MLFPIPGSSVEPAYPVTTPVRFGARVMSQAVISAREGVRVRAERTIRAREAIAVRQQTLRYVRHGLRVGTLSTSQFKSAIAIRSGEGFVIVADIYPEHVAITLGSGGTYPVQFIRPRLSIGGVEVQIIDFTYERPAGRLGSAFNATVAQFDTTGLDPLATVDFGYMIYNPLTATEHYVPRMTGGKLLGREYNIGFRERGQQRGPNDTVQISAIDIVGDRFTLRPKQSFTLYDPTKVKVSEVTHDSPDSLRYLNGTIIPVLHESVLNLSAYDALRRAYTTIPGALSHVVGVGLGFSKFITNIPNYQISRADFTIEGGWNEGALPFFAMYGPLFFDIGNNLIILNITYPLPAGFSPRVVANVEYQKLTLIMPVKDYTNSVVVSYKADAAEVIAEERAHMYIITKPVTDPPSEQGIFGQPGYTRTETTRQVEEVHHVDDTLVDTLVSSVDLEIKVRTFTNFVAGDGGAGALTETHREITQNFYNADLKTGHHKEVYGIIATGPDASLELVKVLQEDCDIVWEQTDDPDIMIQTRTVTRIEGMLITVQDTKSMLGHDGLKHDVRIKYPVLVAEANGILNDDVDTGFGPIREITATLRRTKGNQMDVEVKDIDLLNGGLPKFSYTQPTTGERSTSRYQAQMRHVLLEDAASIALIGPRKPAGVNAGELPRSRAIQLGWDVLKYLKNPRFDANVIISGIDLTLDRGSVIVPMKRGSEADHFIVAGTAERGVPKRDEAFEITMTLHWTTSEF
jgi:hypothetical protein